MAGVKRHKSRPAGSDGAGFGRKQRRSGGSDAARLAPGLGNQPKLVCGRVNAQAILANV